eukprot:SAG11_NODE_782_length_7192_cov_4.178063_3_plen_169_part_00
MANIPADVLPFQTTRMVRERSYPHGSGKYCYRNGDVYNGQWRKGKRHGNGTLWLHSGERYEGTFKADRYDGVGCFFFTNGSVCKGSWKAGRQHGRGRYQISPRQAGADVQSISSGVRPCPSRRQMGASFDAGRASGLVRVGDNSCGPLGPYVYKRWQFTAGRSSDGVL